MSDTLQDYLTVQAAAEKSEKLKRYVHLNRYARKYQIVFAGSSLMEQFPIDELVLDLKLPVTIYNRGVGGFTTAEFISALDTCVYELEPETLLLSIGTNDLNAPDCSLDRLEENCSLIIDEISSHLPNTRIIWMAYFPVNAGCAVSPWSKETLQYRTNTLIKEANERIGAMMVLRGIEIMNVNDLLIDAEGNLKAEYTVDGIHMYADGYYAILERVMRFLLPGVLV